MAELKPDKHGTGHARRVKKTRQQATLQHRLDKTLSQLFGGRSLGNIAAALLLVISIFVGIWATLQSVL